MKAKNVSSVQKPSSENTSKDKSLEERVEVSEINFKYALLLTADKYRTIADSNLKLIHEVEYRMEHGERLKFYQDKQGYLTYEVVLKDKVGF